MEHQRFGGRLLIVICAVAVMVLLTPTISPFMMAPAFNEVTDKANRAPHPPAPAAVNGTAEIESTILKINEALLTKYLQRLQDFETRYSYRPDKCFRVTDYICSVFESNGLVATRDPFVFDDFNMVNSIGEKLGAATPDTIYIICSHSDSTGTIPWSYAPGADDNGSGTAAVLAAAEILSDYEFNATIRFIAFSGEEQGLCGSEHYAANAKAAGENVAGVINLDMIGYNPESPSYDVRARHNALSQSLVDFTENVSNKYQHLTTINVTSVLDPSTNSDHASFWPEYEAIHLFEHHLTPNYHSSSDIIANMNMTYCANCTQIAIAVIAELAGLNSTDMSPPAHTPGFPPPNGYGKAQPDISIEVTDPAGLNTSTLRMWVNGIEAFPINTPIPLGYNFSHLPPGSFSDGETINVTVTVNDTEGHGFNYSWEFIVDGEEPAPPKNPEISLTLIEAVKQGVVIDRDAPGIDNRLAQSPSVIYHDGEYKMWYSAQNNTNYHIAYANSSDGINWDKHGPVLTQGSAGEPDSMYPRYATVIFDSGQYKMWYSGRNISSYYRIMYANSTDGISWTKNGIAIDLGGTSEYDTTDAYTPGVVKTDEYEMWYTGFNGDGYWLLYANSSDGVVWNKHPAPLLHKETDLRYCRGRIAFSSVSYDGNEYNMWYSGFDGSKHRLLYANSSDGLTWNRQGLAVDTGVFGTPDAIRAELASATITSNETKLWYSGRGSDGYWRILYSNITHNDNRTDLRISWTPSASDDIHHYEICRANNLSALCSWETYLKVNDTSFVENGLGDENKTNYYYRIRAVDRVGYITESPHILGKIGTGMVSDWNLIANPFVEGDVTLTSSLASIDWDAARAYDAYDPAAPWKSNISGRPTQLNTLITINQTSGIWAHVPVSEVYASAGHVSNTTTILRAGWNLVAYPHHDIKTVNDALAALPWDAVEEFDPAAAYDISTLTGTDSMYPGRGYWIRLTSAAVWDAVNL